jgi:hypothetical protein
MYDTWMKQKSESQTLLPYPGLISYYNTRKEGYVKEGGDVDIFDDAFSDIDVAVATDGWYDLDGELEEVHILTLPEDYSDPAVEYFIGLVDDARRAGATDRQIIDALKNAGLDLERPTSAGLAAAKKEIERLTKELEEAKKARPPPPPAPAPDERYAVQLGERILAASDPFAILNVTAQSTDSEVTNAYRQVVALYHPDVYHGADASEITKKIIGAYQNVKTAAQRQAYAASHIQPQVMTVEVGRPTIYCPLCQRGGNLVRLQYSTTYGTFKTGTSYDLYKCTTPGCKGERIATYYYNVFQGVG